MSPKTPTLLEGAFIISDAHYSERHPNLLHLIEQIHSQELLPTQLILMGDIFDALFGDVAYTERKNRKMIRLLNEISKTIEVIYLEGNHDFNIREYFDSIKIYPLSSQPLMCLYNEKKVSLAHGDFDGNWSYKLYVKLIRNRSIVKFLTLIDSAFNNPILKKLDEYLAKKEDCREFVGFESFIKQRGLQKYGSDFFIEGHYHQNKQFDFDDFSYINLGAFACNQRYFVIQSLQNKVLLQEKNSHKEM